jgi:hypothetical protein
MTAIKTLLGTLAIALVCWSEQAHAFECPQPAKPSPGVLQETQQDQQALTRMFAGGNIEDKIGVAAVELQKKYPGATDAELVNYMIGAYCPAVAQMQGLSDQQRTAKVEHFAATLFELLAEQKL